MNITPIKHIKAVSFLEEIETDGSSPIKIIGEDYLVYLAKNSKNKTPASDIINELLSYYFLNLWGIPTPPAALINIDGSQIPKDYTKNNHKPHFYDKPTFGSKWIEAIDANVLFAVEDKWEYNKFKNPEVLFDIGLFDIWVENDDRKESNHNLLFHVINEQKMIIPIDHAFIFSTVGYKDLNPNSFCPIDNENIFVTPLAQSLLRFKKANEKWHERDRENFYLCISRCKEKFTEIVQNVPPEWGLSEDFQIKISDFLFNEDRNKKVFDEYLYKMTK